LTWKSSSHCY